MKKTGIFEGCNELAKTFGEARKKRSEIMETLDKTVGLASDLLLGKVQTNLLNKCTPRDKEFLNLRTTDGETILCLIIKKLFVLETVVPGLYKFQIQYIRAEITDSEINSNGFYFDSGRQELKDIIREIFSEMLDLSVNVTFYRNEKQCLTFWCEAKTYVLV